MANRKEAKEWARAHLKGLFTSPSIPFTADFKLDEAGMRKNVAHISALKADGIGFGFTEPWVMTLEERKRGMEVAVDAAKGTGMVAYLHATDHSVPETIGLINHAKNVGADAVMVWVPYEWAKSQDMAYDFYDYVAARCDIAIFSYNTYHSGINLAPETIARIASIPNICAVKDAINDPEHVQRCHDLCGNQVVISDPFEENMMVSLKRFDQQVLLGTTSVQLMQSAHYQPVKEYFELWKAGKKEEAERKFKELQPLRDLWTDIYTVLWANKEKGVVHPLAYIKYWMDQFGMVGGLLRPPMKQLTDQERAEFKKRLESSGWMEKLFPKK